jgi:gliding motility-associated-like protein
MLIMLKKFVPAVILIFLIIISPLILNAQNPFGSYNPFVNAGTITPAIDMVPENAIISAPTFARFRFGPKSTSRPAYNSSGSASYGEVEDYQITILCSTPPAPVIGTIIQPSCTVSTGSLILNGLPSQGIWTLTLFPAAVTITGTGTSKSITGLVEGTYTFKVTSAPGCISGLSAIVVILPGPAKPTVIIKNPAPVCSPSRVDLTIASVTAGSTEGLTYSYWTNPEATKSYSTPATANTGTYYIKGTTTSLCYDVKPVTVTVSQKPSVNAGPDQVLEYQFTTGLNANDPGINETGSWSVFSGSGKFINSSTASTTVSNLSIGKNVFIWTITNQVCPASSDSLTITVHDLVIPTLITPNMDGRNDYFVIRGRESLGKLELIIFDRTGMRVYSSKDYKNDWNGVDEKGNPLPDDTYFYILKIGNGDTKSKYIVVRR